VTEFYHSAGIRVLISILQQSIEVRTIGALIRAALRLLRARQHPLAPPLMRHWHWLIVTIQWP